MREIYLYVCIPGKPRAGHALYTILLATTIAKIYNVPDIKGHQRERNTPLMP